MRALRSASGLPGRLAVPATAMLLACPVAAAAHGASPACGQTSLVGVQGTAVRPGVLQVLVPTGADALLVCRYRGLSASVQTGAGGVLLASGLTRDTTLVREITANLDGLKAIRRIACPMYELLGRETATFYYSSGPSVTLTIELGGCSDLSNGHLTREGLDTPALQLMQALLRPTASGTTSPSPTASRTTSPSASPTASRTTSPSPTASRTTSPSASPTASPTTSPSASPTTSGVASRTAS